MLNSNNELTLQGDIGQALAFIDRMRPLGGFIKIAAISPDGGPPEVVCFDPASERGTIAKWLKARDGHRNLYCELNPPRDKRNRKSGEADIAEGHYHAVDCDPKLGETAEDAKARHRQNLLSGKTPKPTIIYTSGNGLVALWEVERPVEFATSNDREQFKSVNAALACALGGKQEGYDSCQSTDHLFRLPYTVNLPDAVKLKKGRQPILAGDVDVVGDPLPESKRALLAKGGPITASTPLSTEPVGPPADLDSLPLNNRHKAIIRAGMIEGDDKGSDRSRWACEVGCAMIRAGLSEGEILSVLLDPQFGISERFLERDDGAERFARRELQRFRKLVWDGVISDFANEPWGDTTTATPQATDKQSAIKPTPLIFVEPCKIPPREWIYRPIYIRKFVGLTAATGGAGKSSLLIAEALAMASGLDLFDPQTDVDLAAARKPQKRTRRASVWYWNGEDPPDELQRRFVAAMKHFRLDHSDIAGYLHVDSGRDLKICIAETAERSLTRIATPIVNEVQSALLDHRIDVLMVDPFVSCHRVSENDNNAIDQVAKTWADIAHKTNSHVHLAHHTRKKNGEQATIEDSRGASALNNAARTRRALNSMTAAEADKLGIEEARRFAFFRDDLAGSSMIAPGSAKRWFKMVSVDLGNGDDTFASDSVGVATGWMAQPELTLDEEAAVVARLEQLKGPFRVHHLAEDWIGVTIAGVLGLDAKKDRARVKGIIEKLEAEERLLKMLEYDPATRKKRPCYYPNYDFE